MDQDQIFGAKIWPKGPDLGFGQITIGKSQIFSKVKKIRNNKFQELIYTHPRVSMFTFGMTCYRGGLGLPCNAISPYSVELKYLKSTHFWPERLNI